MHKNYKLILMDVIMPEMDGIQTAEEIQKMINNKEINDDLKIVFVSGNVDENLKSYLKKIDCFKDCFQKPLKPDRFEKIIQNYYQECQTRVYYK